MVVKVFFNLIRWQNLCMLALSQILFKYRVFPYFNTTSLLSTFEFTLLLASTIFIAAGGYIINDVFDVKCDIMNKPHKSYIPSKISIKRAKLSYGLLTCFGVLFGVFLSFKRELPLYAILFIGIAILLFFYSSFLKRTPFLGNFIVALLVTSSLLIFAVFDTIIVEDSKGVYYLYVFLFFSFFFNLLREIIKDIQDLNGDYNVGMKTLPIILGIERTKKTILVISLIPLYFSIQFVIDDLKNDIYSRVYFAIFIIIPFLYFIYKTYNSTKTKQFEILSTLLKWILIFGLVLIFMLTK